MFRKMMLSTIALAVVCVTRTTANAFTTTTSFATSAQVLSKCTAANGGTMTFTAYDPTGSSDSTGSTSISVNCTKGTSASIALDAGKNPDGSNNRFMVSSTPATNADKLGYTLYKPSGAGAAGTETTTPWAAGDSFTAGTSANAGTAMTVNVFGRISAGTNQAISADTYGDTITATVTY